MNNAMRQKTFHNHPAHHTPVLRHNMPVILHVTVCANRNIGIKLDQVGVHATLAQVWRTADDWRVGEYVIMPDHLHFFCTPGKHDYPSVRRWSGHWKREAGKSNQNLRGVFQEDCWDTQLRDLAHHDEKLAYMRRNPERKGLVASWENWPYRGKVFDVNWM